ncbi:hypothetical protein SAMN04488118_11830 [Epibacterium ulvae]|uniref:Uncharacterized protein n=1 Tax=Epibacterium ulvae TaxID=1156985 RepID=A0A1G5RI88_9RHOB|nr:hypothetical protein SAMN04488118_11830 [Epibacterium ulvae]
MCNGKGIFCALGALPPELGTICDGPAQLGVALCFRTAQRRVRKGDALAA